MRWRRWDFGACNSQNEWDSIPKNDNASIMNGISVVPYCTARPCHDLTVWPFVHLNCVLVRDGARAREQRRQGAHVLQQHQTQ